MVEAWVWDAGCWGDPTGQFTRPRILSALRVAEGLGHIRIKALRYASAVEEVRLQGEPQIAYEGRIEALRDIQKKRVEQTAHSLGYAEDDKQKRITPPPPTGEHPRLFVVVMPPGEQRTAIVHQLLKQKASKILIVPAVFTGVQELTHLMTSDQHRTQIIPFLPYRCSAGMQELRRREQENTLQAVNLHVFSGPYPSRRSFGFKAFLAEFCLAALDCLISTAGAVKHGSIIYKETRHGLPLPILLGNWMHEDGIISSVVLSTTGNFQEVNFDMQVCFNGSRLDLTDAFRETVYRGGPKQKNLSSESGHDPSEWTLNGYLPFLLKVLQGERDDLPTLACCLKNQKLLDRIFEALAKLPAAATKGPQQMQISF